MTGAVVALVDLPPEVVKDINTLLGWVGGIIAVACTAKIIFVGARMAWDHKHNPGLESPTAAEFLAAVIGWIIAGGAAVTFATVLIQAGQAPESSGPAPGKSDLVHQIQEKYPPLKEN